MRLRSTVLEDLNHFT